MKTVAALIPLALTLSACSGVEGAKCAEDADCGSGLVCFTSTSPTIQKFFRVASYNRITRQLVPSTCVEPAIGSDGRPVERLGAPSLLSSLALMALQDLSGIVRIAKCPCGKLFPSAVPSSEHCSEQCRWKWQKRREKAKKATTS